MVICPECNGDCGNANLNSNAIKCPICNRLVYIIRDPRDPSKGYAAISNSDELVVPNDVLTCAIIDQSPTKDPPRNMIIEFLEGKACLIVQCSNSERMRRKSLDKPAAVLHRDVIVVRLPKELMTHIRLCKHSEDGGKQS